MFDAGNIHSKIGQIVTDFYEGKFLTIRHYLVFSSLIGVSWSCARYDTIIEKVSGGIKKELPGICKVCVK